MLKQVLALGLAGLLAGAAQAAPAGKSRSAPPHATNAAAAGVDVRDPQTLIGVLETVGATAKVARREGDAVFLTVTSPTEVFSAQFAGCDNQGRNCQALLFDRRGETGSPTLTQLNAFNQTSVMCRLYQDKEGRPHTEYSGLLFPHDGQAELLTHISAWRGCLGDFNVFIKDPAGFLAGAQ
jgi:hypothetical protein